MKTFPALLFALLLISVAGVARAASESAASYASEMAVNADTQAAFYTKYPDLADEQDVVAAAARALATEPSAGNASPAEALAARARAILAQRTPQEWQHKAVTLYPELGISGSELNLLFLRRYHELQAKSPQFVKEPSWPVLLARRCADELGKPKTTTVVGTPVTTPSPSASSAKSGGSRSGFWLSLLNVTLLVAVLVQPGLWLFRCSRAFAGQGAPLTFWQRALRPAAWGYFGGAFLALCRTFPANADERFIDRFGITLLVSLLTGVAVAVPVFAAAIGWRWWRGRTSPPDKQPPGASAPRATKTITS